METREIVIPYKPREWAKGMHESLLRWLVLILHRRAGKTTAVINHHQRAALDDEWEARRLKFLAPDLTESDLVPLMRERVYCHIMPTYKQAKNVAWDMLKYYANPIPGAFTNEQELSVRYPNGSRLMLFGADSPDSFRGIGPSGVSFDEYSQQPSNIFGEVLSKALADHLGYAIFLGTIKGKNHLYRTYEAGKNDPEWFSLWQNVAGSLATESGPTIIALRRAVEDDRKLIGKGLMMEEEFEQEWNLSTEAAIKGSYYGKLIAKARNEGRIKLVPYDKSIPAHTFWDLGVGANLVCIIAQRVSNEVKIIDTWQGSGDQGLLDGMLEIKKKPYFFGQHFFPHDVTAREETTGKTRKEQLEQARYDVQVVPDIGVQNGVAAVQRMFNRLWIDEGQVLFLEAITQYHQEWDEKRGMFQDNPYKDWASHFSDALRYLAVSEDKMSNEYQEVRTYRPQWAGYNRK